MPIDFPNSPSTNDTHTVGSRTWTYTGVAWVLTGSVGLPDGGVLDGGQPSNTAQLYTYSGGTP